MALLLLKVQCDDCGGNAHQSMASFDNEIIVEFLEETPFKCEDCGKETYINIEKSTN